MRHMNQGGRPAQGGAVRRGTIALLVVGGLSSCVTNEEYQRSVDLTKRYQTELLTAEAEVERLKYENERLRGNERNATISGLNRDITGPVEARLDALAAMLDDVEGPIEDVMRFDVEGGYIFMIQDKLLFASGSADLGNEGRAALEDISRQIGMSPHGTIYVRGHTDSDPVKRPETLKRFPHGNIQLSAERAVAVAALLAGSKAIPAKDIAVMGFGPHMPIAANSNSDNKRLNRRVEIFVAEPGR